MSFSPPPFPAAGATFQYGNIIWQFDGTAGVWNIQNASLVGAQGPVGPPGPQGDPGEQGDPGDPSVGDGQSMIVSGNVITARLGTVGITGVLGVSNRFNVVNGIAHHLPASNGASGIASFDSAFFSVSGTGHVSLVGSLNSGVTSFNGLTGAVTLTGDGGAIVGVGNNIIRARVATASLTGVASFPTTDFGVVNGAVSLTGNVARTNANNVFTGTNRFTNSTSKTDIGLSAANARFTNIRGPENTPITILTNSSVITPSQASLRFEAADVSAVISYGTIIVSGISANRTYTLPDKTGTFAMVGDVPQANSVVTSLNGLTGDRTLTGDGGAIIGAGNNTIRARLAETGVTGVASFNSSFFSVSSGAVSLAPPYSVIGVTGIGFGTSDAGLTGKINITSGSNITLNYDSGTKTITINSTGIVGATGDTVVAGAGIGVANEGGNVRRISNIGVTGIGFVTSDAGLTGKINITSGSNITLNYDSGTKTITIGANVAGNGASITANAQQVLFASGNRGATGSNNFLFDGTSATFGGNSTSFTVTGPNFAFGVPTKIKDGIHLNPAEFSPWNGANSVIGSTLEVRGSSGTVQRYQAGASNFTVSASNAAGAWSNQEGVVETIIVLIQSTSGRTGQFADSVLVQKDINQKKPILCGATGAIDVFSIMRIKTSNGGVTMGFVVANGMTAPGANLAI